MISKFEKNQNSNICLKHFFNQFSHWDFHQVEVRIKKRFENNQNTKHYHFTIRRTQTRCLMNHITIPSDISPYLYCETERGENGGKSLENGERQKVILQQQDFSISHETSNFLWKMKSLRKI